MENDIIQYAIDVQNPIDESTIRKALEVAGIDVIGIDYRASWTYSDYHQSKPPYDSI